MSQARMVMFSVVLVLLVHGIAGGAHLLVNKALLIRHLRLPTDFSFLSKHSHLNIQFARPLHCFFWLLCLNAHWLCSARDGGVCPPANANSFARTEVTNLYPTHRAKHASRQFFRGPTES
jgi:hypothetical protein